MAVGVERFLCIQEVFCEVLLEENEAIKNKFDSVAAVITLKTAIPIKESDVSDSIGQ